MSKIREIMDEQRLDTHPKCTICGRYRADNGWYCHQITLYMCRACAIKKLPMLLVDAVHPLNLQNTLKDFELNFWRAGYAAAKRKAITGQH